MIDEASRAHAALLFAAILSLPSTARATPWRPETGLPPAPAPGEPFTEPAPVTADGVAHPSTRVGPLGDFTLGLAGDLFATYRLTARQGETYNDFELSHVQLTGWAQWAGIAGLNITLESLRSASTASYMGIDGDSVLPRFKWAFVEITPLKQWLSMRAGMIPDLLLQHAESSWGFRVQGPIGLERDGMFTPGDVGASVEAALPIGLGAVAASIGNGEGTHLREQNNGKNITVALRLAPLRHRAPDFLVHLLYRDGSIGPGSAANSRLSGGVTYTGARFGAGAIGTWAIGWQGVGSRDAAHATMWVRGELPLRFLLLARADLLFPDLRDAGTSQVRAIVGAGWALPMIARLVVSYEGTFGTGALASQLPALPEHALLVQVEARL